MEGKREETFMGRVNGHEGSGVREAMSPAEYNHAASLGCKVKESRLV